MWLSLPELHPIFDQRTNTEKILHLEIPRLQFRKHALGIILFLNTPQPIPILLPVPRKDILLTIRIILVHVPMMQTHLLAKLDAAVKQTIASTFHCFVVIGIVPDEDDAEYWMAVSTV